MSDNQARLRELSLLMPAIQYIQKWSHAKTAEYVTAIESAFKAEATVEKCRLNGYINDDGSVKSLDDMRCPACGTLDGCGCASPGWPAYASTPFADMKKIVEKCRAAGFLNEKGEIVPGIIVTNKARPHDVDQFYKDDQAAERAKGVE